MVTWRRWTTITTIGVGVLFLGALATTLGVLLTKNKANDNHANAADPPDRHVYNNSSAIPKTTVDAIFPKPSQRPTMAPSTMPSTSHFPSQIPTMTAQPSLSMAPTSHAELYMDQVIPSLLTLSPIEAFDNPHSPQYQAALFLTEELLLQAEETNSTSLPIPQVVGSVDRMKLVQRYALATLYYATDGQGWWQKDHWMRHNVDECTWRYIKCAQGQIYSFDFTDSHRGMIGRLPNELGLALTHLVTFSILSSRQLTGTIPTTLAQMTRLETLKILYGNVTSAPNQAVGDHLLALTTLAHLDLSGNRLAGSLPESISSLSNLRTCNLEANLLTGTLPSTLGLLTRLESLILENNTLTGSIPNQIGGATHLNELRLDSNALTGTLPLGLYHLTNMVRLQFSFNQLTGSISTHIGDLVNLKIFAVDHNQMTGNIPVELAQLTNTLSLIYVNSNLMAGTVPHEVCSLRSMATHGFLRYFNADCASSSSAEPPPHECSCCNWCCIRGTNDCFKQ